MREGRESMLATLADIYGTEANLEWNARGATGSRLICPLCQDTQVNFHSRLSVTFVGKAENSAIFVCSASHTFIVPFRTLLYE